MRPLAIAEKQKALCAIKTNPAITITMPFDPKMSSKDEICRMVKRVISKVETELLLNYASVKAIPVINKLHKIFRGLNYHTYKKSVVILLSDTAEKVFYLSMNLEEKVIFDSAFSIKDLIYNRKQIQEFLVVGLSDYRAGMYILTAPDSLKAILKQTVCSNPSCNQYQPGKNCGETERIKALKRYLQHFDNSLGLILNSYPLPVFILGNTDILNRFKNITKNKASIVGNVHCNYEDTTEEKLVTALQSRIADWNEIHNQYLVHKIENASDKKSLCYGVNNVLTRAGKKNGKLLVIEKDYSYHATNMAANEFQQQKNIAPERFYIKSPIDSVIEKVLENDGDIEFVENGKLKEFNHVALI